jgi:DNA-binding NarL/FixJ family response regulator
MINNSSAQCWDRLAAKQLDQQFVQHIIAGLNCSPFEAEAVLQAVHQIYALLFDCSPALRPGRILLPVLSVEAPPGPRLVDSRQALVVLTLEDLDEDLQVRKTGGVLALRRHRLVRVCHEALQQGGLLTLEDLAYRLFNCGQRTLCRDLQALREEHVQLPLRSTIKDMGRTLSHRRLVVEQWLDGKEYSEIARATCHSVASVQNYVEKFKRVALLAQQQLDLETLAFLARLSKPLTEQYLQLLRHKKPAQHRLQELRAPAKKNSRPHPTRTRL